MAEVTSESDLIRPVPSATFREMDQGGVLLDVQTGAYFELNESGRVLWQAIVSGSDRQSLIDTLCERYDIPAEEAAAYVASFLDDLGARSLLAEPAPDS